MKNIKKIPGIVIVIFLSFLSCKRAKKVKKNASKPNIILIYLDDCGYGDLECYGHPVINTPNINKLSKSGIRFTSFYAPASVCSPSRAGILTGRYPIRNSPLNYGPSSKDGLPLSEITIAEMLKNVGYKTGAIGKWHLGHLPKYLPTAHGFDSFYGLPYSNDMILPWCPWLTNDDKLMLYRDTTSVVEVGKKQEDLTLNYHQEAISFIEKNKENPFFLYLAHSMPHLPISTSKEFQNISEAGKYGDVIETIDWTVGEIVQTLEENKLLEDTMIIFTSDNGPWQNPPERMLQEGTKLWHAGSSGLLRGSKATTYEGGFRVPCIISWPNQIPANQKNNDIVSGIDIFPTIAEISGFKTPDTVKIDGMSILPLLQGKGNSPRKTFMYSKDKTVQAIRKGAWKLRHTEEQGMELFNLNADPSEMYNRAQELPELSNELLLEMQEFAKQTNSNIYEH